MEDKLTGIENRQILISSMEESLRQMEKSSVIFQSLLIEKSFRVF